MYPAPGTPVLVWVGPIRHVGVVSDRWWGKAPMVISHSRRRGGTFEEPWAAFAGSATVYPARLGSRLPTWAILARARSWIGARNWNLMQNCEHHVRYALGLEAKSPQLRGAIVALGALLAIVLAGRGRDAERRT